MRVHLKNVSENPHVGVPLKDTNAKVALRFHGAATVRESKSIKEQVMATVIKPELDKDLEKTGLAVVIRVDRVTSLSGQAL